MSNKVKFSAAMLALLAAGATAPELFDQFMSEKEGNALVAVVDPGGIWSLCHGVTVINGKRVVKGQTATEAQCKKVNAIERDKALAWVERNIKIPLTEPQKAGIASFCPYNIGPGKCFPSTFYKRINAGDRTGATGATGPQGPQGSAGAPAGALHAVGTFALAFMEPSRSPLNPGVNFAGSSLRACGILANSNREASFCIGGPNQAYTLPGTWHSCGIVSSSSNGISGNNFQYYAGLFQRIS